MSKASVYVTRLIPQENIDALRTQFDVEVNMEDRALSPAELKEKVRGRSAVVSLLTDNITGEVLDAAGLNARSSQTMLSGTIILTWRRRRNARLS